MADINYTKIEITYSNRTMTLCFDKFSPSGAQLDDDTKDDGAPDDAHLEINIARVFHKVLNLLKTNEGLFEKRDYQLLGGMLEKLLFGRISNTGDSRVANMELTEKILSLSNSGCRVFLNFNQPSQIAVLPWEYTYYRSRGSIRPGQSWYLSAYTDVPFHLIRRVASEPTPDLAANTLFVIVIMNLLGNGNTVPAIDSRTRETAGLKNMFKTLQEESEKGAPAMEVMYIENEPVNNIVKEIESIYQNWQQEYHTNPSYVVHYIGHATLQNERGQLAVTDKDGNAAWMEDKLFASYFDSDMLTVPQPSLVCFQACDSGKIGIYQNELRGVAYQFAKMKIPAVIGMQNEINIPDSSAFFTVFYQSLLAGKDVAEATTAGRNHLGRERNCPPVYQTNAFGSPVLFVSTEEPVKLMKPKAAIIKTAPAQDTGSASYRNEPALSVTESRIRTDSGITSAKDVGESSRTTIPAQSAVASQTESSRSDAAGGETSN